VTDRNSFSKYSVSLSSASLSFRLVALNLGDPSFAEDSEDDSFPDPKHMEKPLELELAFSWIPTFFAEELLELELESENVAQNGLSSIFNLVIF